VRMSRSTLQQRLRNRNKFVRNCEIT